MKADERRERERVPLELPGRGSVTNRDTSYFHVEVLDFSILGLQMLAVGDLVRLGDRVRLELELSSVMPDHETVTVFGKIVRCIPKEGEQLCGVRVELQDATTELEALDDFYIQHYFDMVEDDSTET